MSATKPMPRHGTRARYRIEIKRGADGKPGKACDRCKSANAKAAAAARASRAANARRATMHIVDADTPPATGPDTSAADPSLSAGGDDQAPGPMETAILADLEDLPADLKIAMHRSLRILVQETARDYDRAEGIPSARAAAAKQLDALITKLRTKREGDGDSALDVLLSEAGFGAGPPSVPDVPDRPAKTRNAP